MQNSMGGGLLPLSNHCQLSSSNSYCFVILLLLSPMFEDSISLLSQGVVGDSNNQKFKW
jgi:hypothetical protein